MFALVISLAHSLSETPSHSFEQVMCIRYLNERCSVGLFQLVYWLLRTARLDISIPLCVHLIHKIIFVFDFRGGLGYFALLDPFEDDFASSSDYTPVRFFPFRHRGLRITCHISSCSWRVFYYHIYSELPSGAIVESISPSGASA